MATSPTTRRHPALPAPPTISQPLRRLNQDEVLQTTKAQRTKEGATVRTTEQDTTEPQSQRQRINMIAAIKLHNGTTIHSHANDDPDEQQQPIIFANEGFDESKLLEGMKTEATQMKQTTRSLRRTTLDPSTIREAIPTRWVHREKGLQVCSRIVAKGYSEKVDDEESAYASTPMFTMLRILLLLQLARPGWIARLGDVSTAFLHAPLSQHNEKTTYIWPPKELCPQQNKLRRLRKAMYGLRSSPKAWQDYLAQVLQELRFKLKSEPNIYTSPTRDCYIMVYVDDLLVLGNPTIVNKTFEAIRQRELLKHPGYIEPQQPQQFLGRTIKHNGDHITHALADSYINIIIEEASLKNCNPVATPGIAHYKPTVEDEALLDKEQRKRYRSAVETAMASLHTTRHCLLYQRTCKRPHSTYRTFQQTSQTLTTLPSRD